MPPFGLQQGEWYVLLVRTWSQGHNPISTYTYIKKVSQSGESYSVEKLEYNIVYHNRAKCTTNISGSLRSSAQHAELWCPWPLYHPQSLYKMFLVIVVLELQSVHWHRMLPALYIQKDRCQISIRLIARGIESTFAMMSFGFSITSAR